LRGQKRFNRSTWLRYRKGMTGTKVVCSEGDCGACTVMLGWLNAHGKLEYRIVDSCIQFLFQLDLCHVITVEGFLKVVICTRHRKPWSNVLARSAASAHRALSWRSPI
jgi:xanthine dehydrogenase small subunit